LGANEIHAFLAHLAVHEQVAAATQNQALNAVVFLYRHVIRKEPGDFSTEMKSRYGPGKAIKIDGCRFQNRCTIRFGRIWTGGETSLRRTGNKTNTRWECPMPWPANTRVLHMSGYGSTCFQLLGHSDVKTTMIYTHVLNKGPLGVVSPLDTL